MKSGKWLLEPGLIKIVDLSGTDKRRYKIRHNGNENMPGAWWHLYIDGQRMEGGNARPNQFERSTTVIVEARTIEIFGANYAISGACGAYDFVDDDLEVLTSGDWRHTDNPSEDAKITNLTPIVSLDMPRIVRVQIDKIGESTVSPSSISPNVLSVPTSTDKIQSANDIFLSFYVDGKLVKDLTGNDRVRYVDGTSVDLYGAKIEVGYTDPPWAQSPDRIVTSHGEFEVLTERFNEDYTQAVTNN